MGDELWRLRVGEDGAVDLHARSREGEEPFVGGHVRLEVVDADVVVLRVTLLARVVRAGEPDAGDLLVIAVVRLAHLLGAADVVDALAADHQVRVRIEELVLHVAVLERDAQLVRHRAVDFLGAEVLDAVTLAGPVDERAVHVGVVGDGLGLVGRDAEGVAPALPGFGAPGIVPIEGIDAGEALDGELGAHLARYRLRHALADGGVGSLDGEVAVPEARDAAHAKRVYGAHLVDAAACVDVVGDDLVHGHGAGGGGDEAERDGEGESQGGGSHGGRHYRIAFGDLRAGRSHRTLER